MDRCHRCGRTGHVARECKQPMQCNKCGMRGHTEKNCGDADNMKTNRERLRDQKRTEICHNCGNRGHMARDCTSRVSCRMCGLEGHYSRECPRNGGSAASLIHSRNHEAGMFAMERQRLAAQETAAAMQGLIPGMARQDQVPAPAPSKAAPPKVMGTTFVVKKGAAEGYKPKPKTVKATLLNPLAEEDKAAEAAAAARAEAEREAEQAAAEERAKQVRNAPSSKRGKKQKAKRARTEAVAQEPEGEETVKARAALGALLGGGDSDSGSESDFDPYA